MQVKPYLKSVFSFLLSALLFCGAGASAQVIVNSVSSAAQVHQVPNQELISINQADAELLASVMNGVGMKKAQAIIDFRQSHGEFTRLEDLLQVKGIGESTLERNRHLLSL